MADPSEDTPYQSLYRRFRPSTFAEVKGQEHVVLALSNAVRTGRVAHAYLFSGPRGTGKTSTARILAKALNCTDLHDGEPCGVCASCVEITKGTSLDVHELDAASNNGVDAMRELVSRAALGSPGRQKVYIVDEVHMLSTAASNALLKTLEEPPAHVVFVLATTDPQKVLPTIQSRTQHFEFRLLGPDTLGALLDQVRHDAGLDLPDEAIDLAVRRGRGSARDALSILDQVAASDTVEDDLPELDEVVEGLAERDVGRALVAVAHLTSSGFSPQQLTGDLVDHLRQGFLALVAPDLVTVSGTERTDLVARAERLGLASLVRAMEVLGRAQVSMRDAPDPRVNLEVALVRLAHPEADDGTEALLARIERLERADRSLPAAVTPSASPASASPAADPPAAPPPAPVAAPPTAPPTAPPPTSTASTAPGPDGATGDGDGAPSLGGRPTLGALRRQTAAAGAPPVVVTEPPAREVAPPSTAPTPAAVRPPAVESAPFPTRDELVQAWGDHIIGRLRPKAKALFQAGRFIGVDGDRALFGLPNEIHRDRCEELRGEIEAVLSDHFGRPVPLVLVVEAAPAGGPGAEAPTPPARPSTPPSGAPADPQPRPHPGVETAPPGATAAVGQSDPPPSDDGPEDFSDFDDAELGEIVDVDNSAEARVLQAFPGAEEVG